VTGTTHGICGSTRTNLRENTSAEDILLLVWAEELEDEGEIMGFPITWGALDSGTAK